MYGVEDLKSLMFNNILLAKKEKKRTHTIDILLISETKVGEFFSFFRILYRWLLKRISLDGTEKAGENVSKIDF